MCNIDERKQWRASSVSQSGPMYNPEDGSFYTTTTYWFYPDSAYRDGIPVERIEIDEAFDSDLPFSERIVVRVKLAEDDAIEPLPSDMLETILRI